MLALSQVGAAPAPQTPPNIVFILADDLGYGDLGCQNPASKIRTPNLDQLASQGMRFTDAHAPSALCTPSRYSILTGEYCWRTHLKSGVLNMWDEPLIAPERLTVAELLRQSGYRTACFGKWHLGLQWPFRNAVPQGFDTGVSTQDINWAQRIGGGPLDHGFDYYFGVNLANDPPYAFIQNDHVLGTPDTQYATVPGQQGHWAGPGVAGWDWTQLLPSVTTNVVDWINANSGGKAPFFVYFAMTGPHQPVAPEASFIGTSRAGAYGDFVQELDSMVGKVLDALDTTGASTNTLVIFTSDNGPDQYAYPRILQYGHFSMGPLRGVKRDIWEGGHRVPFIARWPGEIAPETVNTQTICLSDFMRTAADVAGAAIPTNAAEDSVSFLPLLLGSRTPTRGTLVVESGIGQFGLRAADWMYIDSYTGDGHNPEAEPLWFEQRRGYSTATHWPALLYQLSADLPEAHNLYPRQTAIAALMSEELLRQRGRVTWAGMRSRSWTDPSNWRPAFGPAKADVLYSNDAPAYGYVQVMGGNFEVNSLEFAGGLDTPVELYPGGPFQLAILNGIDLGKAAADLLLAPKLVVEQSQPWIVPGGHRLSTKRPVALNCLQLMLSGSGDFAFGGGLTGPGALVVRNSGTVLLQAESSFSGGTEISGGGQVIAGANLALGTGLVSIPNNSTLELEPGISLTNEAVLSGFGAAENGTGDGALSLNAPGVATFAGPITLSGDTGFSSTAAASVLRLDGGIHGTGNLAILPGLGQVVLDSTNDFSGGTTIQNGRLAVNGSLAGTYLFVSGGELSGTGTISAPVNIQAGGSLSPGAVSTSVGDLTLTGTLLLANGSTTHIRLNSSQGTCDRVAGLSSVQYGGTLVLANLGNYPVAAGQRFHIFEAVQASGNFTKIRPVVRGISWSFNPATGVLEAN